MPTVPVPIPAFTGDLPDPSDRSTYGVRGRALWAWEVDDAAPGINAAAEAAYDNAVEAGDAALIAAGAVGFRGSWSAQTGAAAIPYAVHHTGRVWALLNNLADVTTSEPGVTGDWADVGGVLRSGDTMTGHLNVPAGATGSQAPRASEVVGKTSATGSAVMPSGTTAQRDGSPAVGYTRFNSTLGALETYSGSAWVQDGWQTTTTAASGTAVDFTGVPANVRQLRIGFSGVSGSVSDPFLVQIGDSGGIETTSYAVYSVIMGTASVSSGALNTAGFRFASVVGSSTYSGALDLQLIDPANNTWAGDGHFSRDASASSNYLAGIKSLSAVLDRVRVSFVGAASFSAGTISLSWRA